MINMPDDYHCHTCGMKSVKLWREYQCMGATHLTCFGCTPKTRTDPLPADRDNFTPDSFSIMWRVAAIVDMYGAYVGYGAYTDEGMAWWKSLPSRSPTFVI